MEALFRRFIIIRSIAGKRVNILTGDPSSNLIPLLRKQITRPKRGNSEGCIERVLPVHDTRCHITLLRATCHSLLCRHSRTGRSMPIIQLIRTSRIYRRSSFASSTRLALSFNRDFPRVVFAIGFVSVFLKKQIRLVFYSK